MYVLPTCRPCLAYKLMKGLLILELAKLQDALWDNSFGTKALNLAMTQQGQASLKTWITPSDCFFLKRKGNRELLSPLSFAELLDLSMFLDVDCHMLKFYRFCFLNHVSPIFTFFFLLIVLFLVCVEVVS